MVDAFSTNSLETIEKQINDLKLIEITDIDSYFEIDRTTKWILDNNFKRVALQFPDELLHSSVKVYSKLQLNCSECSFFILADTSYGNCCVDLVAAEHYEADCIIHYGHSCLSPVEKLPTLLIFDKSPLNLNSINQEIDKLKGKLIVFYDVSYQYLHSEIVKLFQNNNEIFISDIILPGSVSPSEYKVLFSRRLPTDLKNSSDSYSFFYIGNKTSFKNGFLFYFNKNKFYQYDPEIGSCEEILFNKTNRELMKRYYLIEKAKDSAIFGILIGTMSVAKYKDAIEHVSKILKKVQKRYYSFLIGKLNCPKLNNFMEVDTYVLVACNENSLIDSKELNKPIITIYELEMAFNCARLWGEEYVVDFKHLLENSEHYVPLKLSEQESDVSLITGESRFNRRVDNETKEETESALLSRDKTLIVQNYSASDFLRNRSWTGLEQNLGQDEIKKAIEGTKGIAAGYESEPIK
ncbi:unnamed protein product [Brachionus calyciflorus]|uniref:2-(3-amino-3-carboxypropyl)histidine synthase subunit 2 n=1 Tax=Brachionus calyciflorus TaxID=104777 RepID=A0A813UWQ5_9BILA|nr:unnamed protein product [Brachionus calyciflorus]